MNNDTSEGNSDHRALAVRTAAPLAPPPASFRGALTPHLPPEELHAAWMLLAHERRDAAVALHLGSVVRPPGTLAGIAACMADSVREGLRSYARFWPLRSQTTRLAFEEDASGGVLRLQFTNALAYSPYEVEYRLTRVLTVLRLASGCELCPTEVRLTASPPPYLQEFYRVFGAPLAFGSGEDALVFSPETLALPFLETERAVAAWVRDYAERLLSRELEAPDTVALARQALRETVLEGGSTVEEVARRLEQSPRSLQRALLRAGTSFRTLLTEVRMGLAREMMRDPEHSLTQIATRLGYADPANFHRAFKRWSGDTPARMRARVLAGRRTSPGDGG